jgi:sugar phosphate isomerase/epimerase
MSNLEILGPYAVTTGIRDAIVWEDEEGAKVQWTAVGEGQVDWRVYMDKFAQLCPQAPVVLEIISGFAKPFPYLQQDFWQAWPKLKGSDFARFLSLARRGKAIPSHKSPNAEAEKTYQREELERSLRYCRETLGIGTRS